MRSYVRILATFLISSAFRSKRWLIEMLCHFVNPPVRYKCPTSAGFPCQGDTQRLDTLIPIKSELYGCKHNVELVLLRGLGEIIDWEDEDEVRRAYSLNICSAHLHYLLTGWSSNIVYNKKYTEKRAYCSLPSIVHEQKNNKVPSTRNRMRRDDAITFINHFNVLCHPGTYICPYHQLALRNKEFHKLKFHHEDGFLADSNEVVAVIPEMDGFCDEMSIDENDDIISDPNYEQPMPCDQLDDPLQSATSSTCMLSQVQTLRAFATACGLNRVTSETDWTEMGIETRRKKITDILKLFDFIYKVAGGKGWEDLKRQVTLKISPEVEDGKVEKMLENLDNVIEDTDNKHCRLKLLSVAIGIVKHTGVSRYLIRQAKLHAHDEITDVIHRRVYYDEIKVSFFANFLTNPDVSVSFPSEAKLLTLSNGKIHSMAEQARLRSYREIFRMFQRYCEERGREAGAASELDVQLFVKQYSLGYSTCLKIMQTIAPKQKLRLQCVDVFRAEAMEAFNVSMANVSLLFELGRIDQSRSEILQREIKSDWNFLTGSLRSHLSLTSDCAMHCLRHALSDPKQAVFFEPCNSGRHSHHHNKFCPECAKSRMVYLELTALVQEQLNDANLSNSADRFRLKRMLEECEMNSEAMLEYSNHVIRSTANELMRKKIISEFSDNDAIATMDFSLKLQPQTNVESQSQWFGKKGISFHCSHILTVRDNEYFQHTFGAVVKDCIQDSSSVSVFADHYLRILKISGIKRIFFRSDNASCYHNASLVATLIDLCQEIGIEFGGYFFSESQDGKGAADRQISHGKRKLRDFVNGGGDASTAAEIVYGLIQPTLLKAYSFYEIDILSSENGKSNMKGVKSFGAFTYEAGGIRVWKHAGIGPGQLFKMTAMKPNQFKYFVRQEGGYLSGTKGFWGSLGLIDGTTGEEAETVEEEEEIETKNPATICHNPLLYYCHEERCSAVYKTQSGLEKHLNVGRHCIKKEVESITDRALKIFTQNIEKNRVVFVKIPVNLVDLEASATNIVAGFALYTRKRGTGVIAEVASRIEKYFHERRSSGRRADAKEISTMIRNMKNPDTSYTFNLRDCPRQGQSQTIINRLLKESEGGKSKDTTCVAKGNKKVQSKKRKNSMSDSDDEMDDNVPSSRSTRKARKSAAGLMIAQKLPILQTRNTSKAVKNIQEDDSEQSESEDEEDGEPIDEYDEIMENIHEVYDELFL